ncbi:MAG: hypothetical protein ACRD0K_12325 [Egibacteraceae bacterium]
MTGTAFESAIESAQVCQVEVDWDPAAVKRVQTLVDAGGMLLLGEMHGVAENTSILYTLIRRFGFAALALEWAPEMERTIARFLAGQGLELSPLDAVSSDGRITAGHFALLRRLREESLIRDTICFSGWEFTSWNARDTDMAMVVINRLSDGVPTLVVAGNLHTRVQPMSIDEVEEELVPMGVHLAASITPLMPGRIDYLSGSLHNLEPKRFPQLGGAAQGNRFFLDGHDCAVFVLGEATAAVVPAP